MAMDLRYRSLSIGSNYDYKGLKHREVCKALRLQREAKGNETP